MQFVDRNRVEAAGETKGAGSALYFQYWPRQEIKEKPMTEETARKAERDPKDQELTKKENEELTHEELDEVSGGFIHNLN
jgi:hypothetical protein